ncbi:MAG: thioredoxin [Bacteroidales bacterium]|nr:thioredoxin [Bacteroidales bacterium]
MVIEFTSSNFENYSNNNDKLVVIDFWAEWCGPCRLIAPIIHELADEYKDSVIFGKVDVDQENDLAIKFGIRNIPTVIFMKNGQILDKIVGAVPKAKFVEKINALK